MTTKQKAILKIVVGGLILSTGLYGMVISENYLSLAVFISLSTIGFFIFFKREV